MEIRTRVTKNNKKSLKINIIKKELYQVEHSSKDEGGRKHLNVSVSLTHPSSSSSSSSKSLYPLVHRIIITILEIVWYGDNAQFFILFLPYVSSRENQEDDEEIN